MSLQKIKKDLKNNYKEYIILFSFGLLIGLFKDEIINFLFDILGG